MLEFFTVMIIMSGGEPTDMALYDTEAQCGEALLQEAGAMCAVTTHISSSPRPKARPADWANQ